jgi:predicted RNA-binding Zn-ribbon protein involved in translation (DUF1610 family)
VARGAQQAPRDRASREESQEGMKKRAARKRSQLVADAVVVLCPYCGEPQPNRKDGSDQWTRMDFNGAPPTRKCASCDEEMILSCEAKVMFQ